MQRITTTTNGRHAAPARRRYWLTPRAWNKRCSHCGMIGSIAYRALGRKFACESCVERLGIRAMESKAWRDGGAKAGAAVTLRHVDPASLRRAGGTEGR